ncbi:MAG: glycosyltransferase family 4 protein [Pseudomonadota bacterium]
MKICFAVKRLAEAVGGAERVLCMVASELAARGHEVHVLTFDVPGRAVFYPLDARVKRIDLGIGNSARAAGLTETLRRMAALRRVISAIRPDVVVGFMHSMFVPLAFSLVAVPIPVLGSEHIVPEHYRTRPLQFGLLMLAAPFLKKITVLSEPIRIRYPGPLRRRMVVMPNPVEAALSPADVGTEKRQYVLLSVGRLDAQKDQATLLRAFALLTGQYPDWRLRIVGEGALRLQLERLAGQLGLEGVLDMPGVTAAISEEYQAADLFVLPSRYEAFGLATAEAMSHGLPAVGFADCPGTNELIIDGRTGCLVRTGADRVQNLADTMSRLMANAPLRREMGKSAREEIGGRFSLQVVGDRWEALLQSMLSPATFGAGQTAEH